MDLWWGLNKEKPSAKSAIFLHFHLLLKACYQRFWKCKKPVIRRGGDWLFSCREEYRIIEPDLGGLDKLEFNMTSYLIPYFVYINPYFVFFYILNTHLLLS
jgi:hypothetical protein